MKDISGCKIVIRWLKVRGANELNRSRMLLALYILASNTKNAFYSTLSILILWTYILWARGDSIILASTTQYLKITYSYLKFILFLTTKSILLSFSSFYSPDSIEHAILASSQMIVQLILIDDDSSSCFTY